MNFRRTGAILGTTVLMTAGLAVSTGTAAQAAVPTCVETSLNDSGYTDYLTVWNRCSTDQRIKVVLAFATDKACLTVYAYGSRDYSWDYPGRFDGLVSC